MMGTYSISLIRSIFRQCSGQRLLILCGLFLLTACSAESADAGAGGDTVHDGAIIFTGSGDTIQGDAHSGDIFVPAPDFGLKTFDFVSEPKEVSCTPICADRVCGSDGCGGECGQCSEFEICSNSGLCEPDPRAGCAGLELAENWSGTFEGEYEVSPFALFPATEGDTGGDLSFTLKCFNSKLIVNGSMTGTASGTNAFELTLAGYYDPTKKHLDGQVPTGSVKIQSYGVVEFEGVMPGDLQPDGSLSGTYLVDAVAATLLGTPVDPSTLSASSEGTWVAFPQ